MSTLTIFCLVLMSVVIAVAAMAILIFVLSRRSISVADSAPSDTAAVNAATKAPDTLVAGCYFNVGLVGPPRPTFVGDPDAPQPEPFVSVVFVCDTSDMPSNIACKIFAPDIMQSKEEMIATSEKSHVVSIKDHQKLTLTTQISLLDRKELSDDFQEKLNLYGYVPVTLQYDLITPKQTFSNTVQVALRWKQSTPVEDEEDDIGAFLPR